MSEVPSWLQRSDAMAEEMERLAEEYFTPEDAAQRDQAAVKLQAAGRGWITRSRANRAKQREALVRAATPFTPTQDKEQVYAAEQVLKVTTEGDEQWMNRLIVELGIRHELHLTAPCCVIHQKCQRLLLV